MINCKDVKKVNLGLFVGLLMTILMVMMSGCASQTNTYPPQSFADLKNVGLPNIIHIYPPSSEIPPEKKKWSAKWWGLWDDKLNLPHVLIVEEMISDKEFIVDYCWGGEKPDWAHVTGHFEGDDLVFTLRNGAVVRYTMLPDGTLESKYQFLNSGVFLRSKLIKAEE